MVAIGHHMADYIARSLGRDAVVIHPPIYGTGPFADYGNFDSGLVTMINPCAVKGLPIFLETAARLPEIEFGVVPGWGTTSDDRRALERLPNVRFLPNARNIDEVLARTRVLLMPSLWYEGFGLIVMESMLRGIPVVASDSGGLVEAKHGTGYVIPVKTIERYEPVFDEHSMPRPVVRENDSGAVGRRPPRTAHRPHALTSANPPPRAPPRCALSDTLDAADLERYLTSLEVPRHRTARPCHYRIALAREASSAIGAPAQAENVRKD